MVRMGILAVAGFDIVIAFLRQQNRRLFQEFLCFIRCENTIPFVASERGMPSGKMAAVVAEADGIRVQVLPGPVQAGELAEGRVLPADAFPGAVTGIGERLMKRCSDLKRQIERICRHAVFLVCGNNDPDLHFIELH